MHPIPVLKQEKRGGGTSRGETRRGREREGDGEWRMCV